MAIAAHPPAQQLRHRRARPPPRPPNSPNSPARPAAIAAAQPNPRTPGPRHTPRIHAVPGHGTLPQGLRHGLDVGSTTVKAVWSTRTDEILWKDYQRHETKQPEKCLSCSRPPPPFLMCPTTPSALITGSAAPAVGRHIGARFVQEVNVVSLAVKALPRRHERHRTGRPGRQNHRLQGNEESGSKRRSDERQMRRMAQARSSTRSTPNSRSRRKARQMGYVGHKLHPVAYSAASSRKLTSTGL